VSTRETRQGAQHDPSELCIWTNSGVSAETSGRFGPEFCQRLPKSRTGASRTHSSDSDQKGSGCQILLSNKYGRCLVGTHWTQKAGLVCLEFGVKGINTCFVGVGLPARRLKETLENRQTKTTARPVQRSFWESVTTTQKDLTYYFVK
jgi:hypothetical protein